MDDKTRQEFLADVAATNTHLQQLIERTKQLLAKWRAETPPSGKK